MCRYVAVLVVVLAVPGPAGAQQGAVAPPATATAPQVPGDPAALARIKRALEAPTPLGDTVVDAPPTFRASVSEEGIDISKFWGEPDAVAAWVHPRGGPWHHEFVNMVTPDEFKGYGAIFDNATKASLAASEMGSALAWKYVPVLIKKALHGARNANAKEEVRRELATFYALHPEARPGTLP